MVLRYGGTLQREAFESGYFAVDRPLRERLASAGVFKGMWIYHRSGSHIDSWVDLFERCKTCFRDHADTSTYRPINQITV